MERSTMTWEQAVEVLTAAAGEEFEFFLSRHHEKRARPVRVVDDAARFFLAVRSHQDRIDCYSPFRVSIADGAQLQGAVNAALDFMANRRLQDAERLASRTATDLHRNSGKEVAHPV